MSDINADWAFTVDGDLELGAPQVDQNGDLLFLHEDGTTDTIKGADGVEICDLTLSMGSNAEKQVIMNRLRTDAPDWYSHPTMGGNLSDLIGERNTKETATYGVNKIISALTYDQLFQSYELNIRPVPISHDKILFVIKVQKVSGHLYQIPVIFNIEHGLISLYEMEG